MTQFLRIAPCSRASSSPFNRASSAAVCLALPTKNAAGENTSTATVVVTVSRVRWLPARRMLRLRAPKRAALLARSVDNSDFRTDVAKCKSRERPLTNWRMSPPLAAQAPPLLPTYSSLRSEKSDACAIHRPSVPVEPSRCTIDAPRAHATSGNADAHPLKLHAQPFPGIPAGSVSYRARTQATRFRLNSGRAGGAWGASGATGCDLECPQSATPDSKADMAV